MIIFAPFMVFLIVATVQKINDKSLNNFYPQLTDLPSESHRRMQYISAGYNRASETGIQCDARPFGFHAKPLTDQIGANNYLSCTKNLMDPKLGSIDYPENRASKLSTRFYNRKMNPISNPDRENHLELVTDLIAHKKPFSVVKFVPNPKNVNSHSLNSSQEVEQYRFQDF